MNTQCFGDPEYKSSPYACVDRLCGAEDCIKCHPENFFTHEPQDPTEEQRAMLDEPSMTPDKYDRIADEYERRNKL